VPHLRRRLAGFLPKLPCAVELVLVNDGSLDGTLGAIQEWAAEDHNVTVISLSRNFGHQAASTAGLDHARGEATVLMDADLQDPPELIIDMIRIGRVMTSSMRSAKSAWASADSKGSQRGCFIA
jgi:glycosyltransferase involved in cell wall biosynthesis